MEEKWVLNRDIKKNHTRASLRERLTYCIENFREQGIIACRTHVDADSVVGMLVVETAAEIREEYKGKFILQLIPHPLEGFLNAEAADFDPAKMELFEKACQICDAIGGLPSRDRKMPDGDKKHADFLFSLAKKLNKDLDIHIDQENNPLEKDTEWFVDKIKENHFEGRVTLVHALSVAAQTAEDRERIYKKIAETKTNVTVCPTAVISMKQHRDKMAPLHNSIAQVDEMLAAGINVSLGTDNISDIFVPECNGDLFKEIQMLASACRIYDLKTLAQIATTNGYKTLKLSL
jgi:cytosine/adenosine deaminase-related metal-dependent hydrolase